MTQGVQYAGEFIIEEAVLISPNGLKTDILTDLALIEINIFEDIFRSSITGNILVGDTRNIISKLPIMGQEKLSLKIATPSLTSKEDAEKNMLEMFDVEVTKHLNFKNYVSTKPIKDGRIFKNGNRLFFLEPMES